MWGTYISINMLSSNSSFIIAILTSCVLFLYYCTIYVRVLAYWILPIWPYLNLMEYSSTFSYSKKNWNSNFDLLQHKEDVLGLQSFWVKIFFMLFSQCHMLFLWIQSSWCQKLYTSFSKSTLVYMWYNTISLAIH
jgi:hypothetical protein